MRAKHSWPRLRQGGGRARFFSLDVASEDGWRDVARAIADELGALHVLVNNAGVIARRSVTEATLPDWHRVMDVNVTGAFLGIRQLAPLIRDSGRRRDRQRLVDRGTHRPHRRGLHREQMGLARAHESSGARSGPVEYPGEFGSSGHRCHCPDGCRPGWPSRGESTCDTHGTRGVGRGSGRSHIVSRVGPIVVRDRRRDACRRRIEFSRRGVDARSYSD